ncbi:MAG: RNA polymerase sigma factor [Isosphaerales bacterium]
MATRPGQDHLRSLETLYSAGALGTKTDGELLECFRTDRGPAGQEAFRILVERYGPMVLGLCRSRVRDSHEAEDAFQATFLVLVRRADSIRRRDTIGPWLHGVATRVARRAFNRTIRRRKRELSGVADLACRDSSSPDGPACEQVIQDEIARLPESFRAPLVLCCLLGLSYDLAARQLGLSEPALRGRLHRARKQLAARLRARGIASSVIGPAIEPFRVALPALPSSLVDSTVRFSMRWWVLNGLLDGATAIPVTITALSEGAIKSMIFQAYKLPAIVALTAVGLLGTVVLAQQGKNAAGNGPSSPVKNASSAPQDRPTEAAPQEQRPRALDIDRRTQVREQLSFLIDAKLSGRDATLEKLLKHIKAETSRIKPPGLPIYVSPAGLGECHISMSQPIGELDLKQKPVSAVLDSALYHSGLSYYVAGDGFVCIDSRTRVLESRVEEIDRKLDRVLQALARLERAK